ncbi:hypothetical protein DB41_GK00070 [Neochlamydia sp. TUME1]|nr:hypothetical protein DB41_GK00070 [Neochlamydia sp. TUME1]
MLKRRLKKGIKNFVSFYKDIQAGNKESLLANAFYQLKFLLYYILFQI